MAVNDLFEVELLYQNVEEVLSIHFYYAETQIAQGNLACKELAEAFRTMIRATDIMNWMSTDTRFYGVKVKCISDAVHNTWESPFYMRGVNLEAALPDLTTQIWEFQARDENQIPTFARCQFSGTWILQVFGPNLTADLTNGIKTELWPEMQILNGSNEGQWFQCVVQRSTQGLPDTFALVDDFNVKTQVSTRFDRTSNTPNTGRKKREEEPAAASRKTGRRSRKERGQAIANRLNKVSSSQKPEV